MKKHQIQMKNKMKPITINDILEAASSINTYDENFCASDLCDTEFQIYDWIDNDKYEDRIKAKDIVSWTCTYTKVGMQAIYFDEKIAAITLQCFRKSDIQYYWVSKEMFKSMKAFIQSLIDDQKEIALLPDDYSDDVFDAILRDGINNTSDVTSYKVPQQWNESS